jgi:hypothetical protein
MVIRVSRKNLHEIEWFLHESPETGCPEGQSGAFTGPDWGGREVLFWGMEIRRKGGRFGVPAGNPIRSSGTATGIVRGPSHLSGQFQ